MDIKSFLLLRFFERAKLPEALSAIESMDGIAGLDAVDGHYGLVIWSKNGSTPDRGRIAELDGIEAVHQCDVVTSEGAPAEFNSELPASYVFIEVENEDLEFVIGAMKNMTGVTRLIRTTGDFQVVATLQGKDFDEIDRRIADEISNLDGVLRLKSDHVIDLDNL